MASIFVPPMSIPMRRLGSCIDVVVTDDVVFAEIVPELHFDDDDFALVQVFKAVLGTQWNVNRTTARHGHDFVVNGDCGCAFHNCPMFLAVLVALQAKPAALFHHNALHFKAGHFVQNIEGTPRAVFMIKWQRVCFPEQGQNRRLTAVV